MNGDAARDGTEGRRGGDKQRPFSLLLNDDQCMNRLFKNTPQRNVTECHISLGDDGKTSSDDDDDDEWCAAAVAVVVVVAAAADAGRGVSLVA